MKILGLLGKTTDEGLSGLSRLWDGLTGGVPEIQPMRAQSEQGQFYLDKLIKDSMQADLPTEAYQQGYTPSLFRHVGKPGLMEYDLGAAAANAGGSPGGMYTSAANKAGGSESRMYLDSAAARGIPAEATPIVSRAKNVFVAGVDPVSPELRNEFIKAAQDQLRTDYFQAPAHQRKYMDEKIRLFDYMGDASGVLDIPREAKRQMYTNAGYDALVRNRDEMVFLRPEMQRRPDAKFDPNYTEFNNLLASRPEAAVGAAALGGGLLATDAINNEAEAGVGGKILGQVSEMGFFSPLERAVGGLAQAKGTGDQMLGMIQKQAGVKPEEVQWTGLGDFLAGKPSVTKAEIEDYLLNNRVELKEVRLGEFSPEQNAVREQAIARYEDIADISADTRAKLEEGVLSSQEARVILEPLYAERDQLRRTIDSIGESMTTKFSNYTTPGGSNYRELLMTMPNEKWGTISLPKARIEKIAGTGLQPGQRFSYKGNEYKFVRYDGDKAVVKAPEIGKQPEKFRSTHYDQPNILAHTRVKDYEQDGQKILHVDEVQSDWHQAGRKQGYAVKIPKPTEAEKQEWRGLEDIGASNRTPEQEARLEELDYLISGTPTGVPDAPFKKNWHELTTRRILQEASEKGYDRVTFTTGQTQAERYDLSKQVSTVMYIPRTKSLRAFGHDGEALIAEDGVTPEKLVDYIGKEPAEKLLASEQIDASKFPHIGKNVTGHVLEGEDLKVGGEGMKGFYDNMMVKAFNKEGKKFGVKVEPYNLKTGKDGEQVWSMEIPPEMRAKRKAEGSPMFAAAPFGLLGAGAMAPDKDAQAAMIAENIRQTPLSSFDLNRKPQPEMRSPRYGLLADVASAFEAGSRNDLLGSGESAARVANALAYGQRPGVLDTIVGSLEAVDPTTWASLLGAMSKGR